MKTNIDADHKKQKKFRRENILLDLAVLGTKALLR